ncbi:MAG: hypothetical protein EOO99_11820 [Pedobacter sp.]|nr:MAG: hypothetical protein EOO99_11820 [Pedobacter sp.]
MKNILITIEPVYSAKNNHINVMKSFAVANGEFFSNIKQIKKGDIDYLFYEIGILNLIGINSDNEGYKVFIYFNPQDRNNAIKERKRLYKNIELINSD